MVIAIYTICSLATLFLLTSLIIKKINNMSSTSTQFSQFSEDPFTLSNNSSLFSVNEYKYVPRQDGQPQLLTCYIMPSSNSVLWIEPTNSCANMDQVNTSSDEACITKPLIFKQVLRQVGVKRFNFLTSDRQIAIDTNKSCCGSLCVSKLGKTNLRILQEKYLSLNGE